MQFIREFIDGVVGYVRRRPDVGSLAIAGAAFGMFALAKACGCFKRKWEVRDKVVIITGASSGIGKSLALHLVRMGARVSLAARREAELKAVVDECNRVAEGSALGTIADVAVRAQNLTLINNTVAHFGKIDVLVLNAGISAGAPFEQVTEEGLDSFESIQRTNYFGPVYATRYALPELIKQHGKIVVISSVFGFHGGPTRCFYSGSKFALHGFYESLRMELASKNVGVTIVCPGPVATEIANTRVGPDGKRATTGHFDLKHAISPELAAHYIAQAIQQEKRLVNFSYMTALLYRLQHICPEFWEVLFLRGLRRIGLLDESKPTSS